MIKNIRLLLLGLLLLNLSQNNSWAVDYTKDSSNILTWAFSEGSGTFVKNSHGTKTSPYLSSTNLISSDTLYLMGSEDGINWNFLHIGALYTASSPDTGVRDPDILKIGSTYYVVFNNNSNLGNLSLISSTNIFSWSLVTRIDFTSIGANARTWGCRWFVDDDDSVHVFVAVSATGTSPDGDYQIYEVHPTSSDLSTWSSPVLITGTSLPDTMIDPFVISKANSPNGKYVIWYKMDDSTNYLEYMSSDSLTSGYTVTKSGNWAGWGTAHEGPTLIKTNNSTWRIYFTNSDNSWSYSESTDNWVNWSSATNLPTLLNQGSQFGHFKKVPEWNVPNYHGGWFKGSGTPAWSTTVPNSNIIGSGNFGGTDWITANPNPPFDITDELTVCFWAKDSDYTGTNDYVFEKGTSRYSVIYGFNSGKWEFYCEGYTGDDPRTALTTSITDNNWHHIAFTFDSTGVKGYLDGVLDVTNTGTTTLSATSGNIRLGASNSGGNGYEGLLAELGLFKRALTPNEINEIYKKGQAGGPYKLILNNSIFNNVQLN